MHVLVTGASGFIGKHLCALLEKKGHVVRRTTLETTGDIGTMQPEDWDTLLTDVEAIAHLAARVHIMHDTSPDPLAAFRQVNVQGTAHLAKAAVNAGIKRFVYLSTVKVHGESSLPDCPFTEPDPPNPQDPYAVSKLEAEQILQTTPLEVSIIRPPLVYGPGVAGNFLRLMQLAARGWPLPMAYDKNRRSMVNVYNLCALVECCLTHPAAPGDVFFVSDDKDFSTGQLLRLMRDALGKPPRLFPAPLPLMYIATKLLGRTRIIDRLYGSLVVDITRVKQTLAWYPPVTPVEAMRETAAWYLS